MKIAQYQISDDYFAVTDVTENEANIPNDWVRVSEFVEVEFTPRQQNEITAEKVQQLDKVLTELMTQIESVRAKKSELLALSYEPE